MASLIPKALLGENDFMPNDYVVRSDQFLMDGMEDIPDGVRPPPAPSPGSSDSVGVAVAEAVAVALAAKERQGAEGAAQLNQVGVVRSVDPVARTCAVDWLSDDWEGGAAGSSGAQAHVPPEECSVYELQAHPFRLNFGDVVLRRLPGKVSYQICVCAQGGQRFWPMRCPLTSSPLYPHPGSLVPHRHERRGRRTSTDRPLHVGAGARGPAKCGIASCERRDSRHPWTRGAPEPLRVGLCGAGLP